MHDLELRQWNSIEHGMGLIRSALELAQHAAKLRTFENRSFGKVLDPYLGNISGALEHAGETLAGSKQPARQKVGRELLKLAERSRAEQAADAKHTLTQPLRTEITKYLNKNDVESLLDTQAFLNP